MKIELHHDLCLALACFFCPLAFLTLEAAEPARLSELRGVWQAHFNHDASRLVVRTRSGDVGLWDARKGTRINGDAAMKKPSNTYVMSPDLRKFLVGFKDGHARAFDASSGSAVSPVLNLSLREDGNPQTVFSPDGATILFFGDKESSVLDVKTGKRIATIPIPFELEEGSDSTAAALFASGGGKCFVMDAQGVVTAYETGSWTPLGQPMKHPAAESAYEFGFEVSKDAKWMATFDGPGENGPNGQLQVWDAPANKPLGDPLSAVNGMSGRFLPGQDRVLVQSGRGEASVRDLPSMSIAYVIKQHDELDGPKVEVFPNGKWLMAWGPDKKVDLIDAVSGNILKTHSSPASVAGSLTPPDSSICYLEIDHSLFLTETYWDNYLLRLSVPELETTGSIRIVDFLHRRSLSSDGKLIMIVQGSSDDERIAIYDAASMKPVEWSKP
jgi:WD40 repeat protein